MFKIHNMFKVGNISVVSQTESEVFLENELRDTEGDWFYWAFCVEHAENKEITFHMQKNRIGYWGPAVSHDLINWEWLGSCCGDSFTYRFAEDESKVYFAHHMLYPPERFFDLAQKHGISVSELGKSRKGNSLPCLKFGDGEISIILTARHHACESTGSYVLEGVLDVLLSSPIPNAKVLCVPFVDYDGAMEGDQGKNRIPHDHNRDYIDSPVYPETAAIKAYADQNGCNFAFDFHSPWHKGRTNDTIFVVRNREDRTDEYERFAELLAAECDGDCMSYKKENYYPPCTGWNQPSPNFSYTMHCRPECKLAFSIESAYFGTEDNIVSAKRLIALGNAFARALKRYVGENNPNI